MTVREQVKLLWKRCFHDSDDFIEFYFHCRYTDDLNSYVEADGRVIAALQRIPYVLTYEGMNLPVAYVSGACTDPEYRKQGVMRRLLAQAHRRMYQEGVMFSTLIPAEEWLKGYYARVGGYTCCFVQARKLLTESSLSVDNFSFPLKFIEIKPESILCGDAYYFFNHFQASQEAYMQHDWEDFRIILADLKLSGGALWGAFSGETLAGLCFCVPEGDILRVTECICAADKVRRNLLKAVLEYYHVETVEYLGMEGDSFYDLGMARIIHVEAMLRLLAGKCPENLYLKIEGDEAIPENNGCYNLEDGRCSKGQKSDKEYYTLSIGELTHLLFKGKRPYMSLMLN